jgi:hypothetical protein
LKYNILTQGLNNEIKDVLTLLTPFSNNFRDLLPFFNGWITESWHEKPKGTADQHPITPISPEKLLPTTQTPSTTSGIYLSSMNFSAK